MMRRFLVVAVGSSVFGILMHTAEVRGKDLTPFLLARLAEATNGKTLRANRALVIANARLGAQVAQALPNHP